MARRRAPELLADARSRRRAHRPPLHGIDAARRSANCAGARADRARSRSNGFAAASNPYCPAAHRTTRARPHRRRSVAARARRPMCSRGFSFTREVDAFLQQLLVAVEIQIVLGANILL